MSTLKWNKPRPAIIIVTMQSRLMAEKDTFAATMLGQIDIVKAAVAAFPSIMHVPGPPKIPLIAHAEKGARLP